MSFSVAEIRKDFPIFERTIREGKKLVYLDSGATSQKPWSVINAESDFYSKHNAAVHRGAHQLAEEATDAYEGARAIVAKFLGAKDSEIIFTKNATESINAVAYAMGNAAPGNRFALTSSDSIVVTEMEHHANLIPWQQITREMDADLEFIPVDEVTGEILWDRLDSLMKLKPKMIALGHVSNVLGSIAPLAQIAEAAHAVGALLCVDGCQAVANMPVSIPATGADFYAFSAHKMGGLFAGGGLWARADLLAEMAPIETGGDMIHSVRLRDADFTTGTQRFEAGTPDASGAVALAAACDLLDEFGRDKIHAPETLMIERVIRELPDVLPDARILGPRDASQRAGLVSFSSDLIHAHDLAEILDRRGVAIRAGFHCAQPLHEQLELSSSARVSVAPYTTHEDLDALFVGLREARKVFEG